MSEWLRILIAGTGGQGVLSCGRWLGDAANSCGLPVVVGQLHGLSQRGGSVQSTLAIGGARSAEIADGMADLLVALEPMEGARVLSKVSRRTTVFMNTRPVPNLLLQSTGRDYPPLASLLEPLIEAAGPVIMLDATELAEQAGSIRALNVVALGLLAGAGVLPFPEERLLEAILAAARPPFAETNQRAFKLGAAAVEKVKER